MKNKKMIIGLLWLSLFIVVAPSVLAGDIQDLINSYSFDYFSEVIDISNITDFISDTNGNGVDDTLSFNVSIHNATAGDYTFYIDLADEDINIIGSTTKNIASTPSFVLVNMSTELLSGNMFNYTLRIYDSSNSLVYREGKLQTQQYSSYEEGYSITAISDSNINNNVIRVDVTINSSKSATENVSVFMKYNDNFISSTKEASLVSGLNSVLVDFDNETIKSTHYNGTYLINRIEVGQKSIEVNHTTNNYDYEDFAKTSYLKSYTDTFIDLDSNNLTDYLQIDTTVNIKTSGVYTIEGDIYALSGRYLTTISKSESLNTGDQVVSININGLDIYASRLNGPFEIVASRLIFNSNTIDSRQNVHITNISSFRDFERPPLPDLNISMNVYYNGSDNLINVSVGNEGNATAFNVFVDIFDTNSSYRDQNSSAVLNVSDSKIFNFVANGTNNESLFIAVADFNNLIDELNESNNVVSNIEINDPPTIPNSLLCDAALCTNNGTFIDDMGINCSGSTDPEVNDITYSIDAFYSSDDLITINSFNNSLQTENLSFGGNENITRYLEISKNANVSSGYMNLSGFQSGGSYPTNPYLEVGTPDGTYEWSHNGTAGQSNYSMQGHNRILNEIFDPSTIFWGEVIVVGGSIIWIDGFDKNSSDLSTRGQVRTTDEVNLSTCTFNEDYCKFSSPVELSASTTYYIVADGNGTSVQRFRENNGPNIPYPIATDWFDWTGEYRGGIITNHDVWTMHALNVTNILESGTGEFNQTNNQTDDLSSAINSALNNGACDCTGCVLSGDDCTIPFLFHSDTAGILEYSDIRINYQTTGPAWSNIGNHSESSVLNWDITDIEPQSEVDLRCRAIDIEGSNIYSNYYDPAINITIALGAPAIEFISPPTPADGANLSFGTNVTVEVSFSESVDTAILVWDPPIITKTTSSDEICEGNICTLTLYSGIRNVFEDGEWKRVEDARSLKDKGFEILYLEEDDEFKIDVIDYNLTSITVDLSTSDLNNSKVLKKDPDRGKRGISAIPRQEKRESDKREQGIIAIPDQEIEQKPNKTEQLIPEISTQRVEQKLDGILRKLRLRDNISQRSTEVKNGPSVTSATDKDKEGLTVQKEFNKDIPIRIWQKNESKEKLGRNFKEDYYKIGEEIIRFTSTDSIRKTYPFGLDKILEFGYNSTTIMLQENDTENMDDARVDELNPSTNFGSSPSLSTEVNSDEESYIRFNMSSIPVESEILDSQFSLHAWFNGLDSPAEGFNVTTHYVFSSYIWNESSITWNNKPNTSEYNTTRSDAVFFDGNSAVNQRYEWNVTSIIKQSFANSENNVTIGILVSEIVGSPVVDSIVYRSKEHSTVSERPYLNITYIPPDSKTIINYTMNLNASQTGATFTVVEPEVNNYIYWVWANDTAGNSNQSVNRTLTIINPLDITELNVVYTNNTERTFRFVVNNTLESTITDISWSLDTGESNESSQFNATLQSGEDYFIYVYHNYTASGNYTIIASVTNGTYSDQESIIIEV